MTDCLNRIAQLTRRKVTGFILDVVSCAKHVENGLRT
jgi:hypothetical protein